jgi:polysaccharide biosynthesis/export protein
VNGLMSSARSLGGGLLLVLAALLTGCATQNLPPAPAQAETADYSYVIGAGDSVNVIVWRNPELSG